MDHKIDTNIILGVIPNWAYCRRLGIQDNKAQERADEVFEEMENALDQLTPRNPKEELPKHPGDYLAQFANTDRLSVFHWTGDKWVSQTNSWMWDPDSVVAWWPLPEVVKHET